MAKRLVSLILLVAFVAALPMAAAAQTVRRGAWVDEVVAVEERDSAAAITRLEAGDIQVFASGLASPDLFRRVTASAVLGYERAYGLFTELTFNPAGPDLPDGRLNPFAVPALREAMNWLVDRDYIVKEIHGGLAAARYLPINTAFPDYARLADVARVLERRYAHDPARARQVFDAEMGKLGATRVGGKWQYKGKPVEITVLIRTEDERRQIGDYVAGLLEGLGFTVERRYATAAEASPLWYSGKPEEGKWHVYTGGWISTVISRDQAANFDYFYTKRGLPSPLWQAYKPAAEFDTVSERLGRREFASMDERKELFAKALELAMKDSVRVWLVERVSFYPRRQEVRLAADLAGGIAGAYLWPHTIRVGDQVGGTLRIAQPSMLTEPWNPIAGSNWIFDMMMIRATADYPTMFDPHTGLHWPQRLERAEVYIKQGLPVGRTLDWVSLTFVTENKVPESAWVDWDAKAQRFITVGEKHPQGLTANRKVVVRYPRELFREVRWHDGSLFSVADVVMSIIMTFDRAKEDSAIFDPAAKPAFDSFQRHFRGVRITSFDPLVIEYYSDLYYLDAEWNAFTAAWFAWPYYAQGPAPWQVMALGIFAERNKQLAFSSAQAKKLDVEWMNLIAGPSLRILSSQLGMALNQRYIPYEPTMRLFISRREALTRWLNLNRWYWNMGHFWVGNGPFFLEKVFPVEKVVQLRRFADFPDPADKWARFQAPLVASADVSGPARVTAGQAATFDVRVNHPLGAYAVRDMQEVKFLLFDARGELALQGPATAVRDGLWRVSLTGTQTGQLPAGATRLEVVVVPKLVSIPTFASLDVVVGK